MRLFLALEPPATVLDELEAAVAPLRDRLPRLRWAARRTYHLTVVFLGDVDEERLSRLRELVGRKLARHRPLTLALEGAGTFPGDPARSRVLWTGLRGDVAGLHDLAGALRKASRDARVQLEKRPYTPHLTLARSREPTDLREILGPLSDFAGTPWQADEVRLMESVPGSETRYDTLTTWSLT